MKLECRTQGRAARAVYDFQTKGLQGLPAPFREAVISMTKKSIVDTKIRPRCGLIRFLHAAHAFFPLHTIMGCIYLPHRALEPDDHSNASARDCRCQIKQAFAWFAAKRRIGPGAYAKLQPSRRGIVCMRAESSCVILAVCPSQNVAQGQYDGKTMLTSALKDKACLSGD